MEHSFDDEAGNKEAKSKKRKTNPLAYALAFFIAGNVVSHYFSVPEKFRETYNLIRGIPTVKLIRENTEKYITSNGKKLKLYDNLQLGSLEHRVNGIENEIYQTKNSQYSNRFLKLALSNSTLDEQGHGMVLEYLAVEYINNLEKRQDEILQLTSFAAESFPEQVYYQIPEEKRKEYAKKDVGRVLSKYAEKIKENMQELVNQLKREISNFLVK